MLASPRGVLRLSQNRSQLLRATWLLAVAQRLRQLEHSMQLSERGSLLRLIYMLVDGIDLCMWQFEPRLLVAAHSAVCCCLVYCNSTQHLAVTARSTLRVVWGALLHVLHHLAAPCSDAWSFY